MTQTLERKPTEPTDIIRLSGLTDLELSKTSEENYDKMQKTRVEELGKFDDLTQEEIKDVLEFRSDSKTRKQG